MSDAEAEARAVLADPRWQANLAATRRALEKLPPAGQADPDDRYELLKITAVVVLLGLLKIAEGYQDAADARLAAIEECARVADQRARRAAEVIRECGDRRVIRDCIAEEHASRKIAATIRQLGLDRGEG